MSSKARIKDIAVKAGVSPTTVSRALSGSGLVAEPTLSQIRAIADQMDYRPNISARNLRTQKSMSVLIVVRDIGNPFYLNIFKGVESVARDKGYSVLMANTEGDSRREAEYFEMLRDGHADGMILMTGKLPGDYPLPGDIAQKVVVALEMIDDAELSHVVIDNEGAASAAVDHLTALGHTRIAHVTGPIPEGMSQRRLQGYRNAMEAAGLPIPEGYIQQGDFSYQTGEAACAALMELPQPPSAIFAANDEMAFGVIRTAISRGLRVPDDLSVLGFDDIFLAEAYVPALTTIEQPCLDIGRMAMTRLLEHLCGERQIIQTSVVPTSLVTRETTAPFKTAPLKDG